MHDKRILIMAGGTGGHVYPALAVADKLKDKGFELFWLGTNKGLEKRIVSDHGYPLLTINVAAVRGKGLLRLLRTPFMLLLAFIQALLILIKLRPIIVLGMGGFVSGPGGIAAWVMRIPLLIHEQNAIAGLTNRLLSPFAVSVMAAFPNAFKNMQDLVVTGNPVRQEIIHLASPEQRFAKHPAGQMNILVLGGSLGAKRLNETVPKTLFELGNQLNDVCQFEIKHQCGEQHLVLTEAEYQTRNMTAEVVSFFADMAQVYAWADLIICRAGALTVSELAACGVASILIPFPYAVDDHQTENAQYLVRAGAAILLQETDFNVETLKQAVLKFAQEPDQIVSMAIKARTLAKPDATDHVVALCEEAADV